MKANPLKNSPVAADPSSVAELRRVEVTRRTAKSIHQPPPHVGSYPQTLRRSTLHALTLLVAAALFTQTIFAAKPPPPPPSSGTLVLDYAGPDGSGAANWGLVAAPSGGLYAVGNEFPADGYWKQLVLASGDGGNSWSVLDEFAPPGCFVDFWGGLGGGIASDSAGNLYVSSFTYDNQSTYRAGWYVRRSTDGGLTWATVDDLAVAPVGSDADDVAIAADGSGNVYVAACDFYSSGSGYSPLWTVRKGLGGTAFSTVDALANSYPKDIFVHPTAGIFVVGQTANKNQTRAWLVRRSTDGGATWSNLDTFQLSSSASAVAMGVGSDASGNIYVVGSGTVLNKGTHWIIRKSTNGGITWTTVDDYQLIAGNSSQARCFAVDANGSLFVAGYGTQTNGRHWVVRKSAGGTGPWTTINVFQNRGLGTTPNEIAADPFGIIFVGGNDGANWLIKKY